MALLAIFVSFKDVLPKSCGQSAEESTGYKFGEDSRLVSLSIRVEGKDNFRFGFGGYLGIAGPSYILLASF